MAVDTAHLIEMIEAEVAQISDEAVRTQIRARLLSPRKINCRWDYWEWNKEKYEETYPCWKVLADTSPTGAGVTIVYCEHGFGPLSPWGVVCNEEEPWVGQDSGWFPTFREAVAEVLDFPAASLTS